MTSRKRGYDVAAIFILFSIFFVSAFAADRPQTRRVTIHKFMFMPASIKLRPGDSVEFINKDFAPHTATVQPKGWDTGRINRNEVRRIRFDSEGRFSFICKFHPGMKGEVVVTPVEK